MPRSLYDISPLEPLIEAGYTVLTPNLRLARRVVLEWNQSRAAQGDHAWDSITVMPVQAWLEKQWRMEVASGAIPPLHLLSSDQTSVLWRQVIDECGAEESSLALLQPKSAADSAASARDVLLQWQTQASEGRWRSFFESDPDCSAFLVWLAYFEAKLHAGGFGTSSDCIGQLLDLPASSGAQKTAPRVALLECGDLPPLFVSALDHVCADVHRLAERKENAKKHVYSFSDHAAQLRGIAKWVHAKHVEDPNASIGVLLTDMNNDRVSIEYQLRRAFDCLGENYASLPVNFSTGTPLADTPVVRDGLLALEFGEHQVGVADVVKVLNSRFFAMSDLEGPLVQCFITQLHDDGVAQLSTSALRVNAAKVKLDGSEGIELGSILMKVAHLRHLRAKVLPGIWADYFSEVLEIWGWPGVVTLDTLEYQQVKLWYEVLDSMKALDAVSGPLEYREALRLLRESVRARMSQPETADSNIQVLGPLEAVGLQFDHLWLVGMQATRWPEPPRPSPFLPTAMQNALSMPRANAEREWAVANGRIGQYSRSVKHLYAAYSSTLDGLAEAPSAVLAGFTPAHLPETQSTPETWMSGWRSRGLEALSDERAPAVNVTESDAYSGGSGLLEDQSQCPFRAFAKRRLKVAPLGDFTIALSPAERGAIVHDALYALWGRVVDHSRLLSLMEGAELPQLVADAAHVGLSRVHIQRQG
ncbi:MAG: hypothetical protein AB8C02_09695, partial [Halioglobus sp.]